MNHIAKNLTITEAKAHFSEIASQAAFGGDCFIVQKRGRPFVVVMSYNAFQKLKDQSAGKSVLERANKLRTSLGKKYGVQEESVEIIRQMRSERSA